jgi:thiamine pyrophosphokinase
MQYASPLTFCFTSELSKGMDFPLTMTFINTGGDKSSLTISGVKYTLTKQDVTTLMDAIITNDIFLGSGAGLVSKYGAQLTQRQTTKYDIQ